MRGGAPHVTCVIPLQRDGVDADRGLAARPLGPRARGHQVTKRLRRRGLLHLPPLAPGVSLDLPGVFHVRFILRGLLFILQALKRECPVLRINQTIGGSGSEERWELARPAVPEKAVSSQAPFLVIPIQTLRLVWGLQLVFAKTPFPFLGKTLNLIIYTQQL